MFCCSWFAGLIGLRTRVGDGWWTMDKLLHPHVYFDTRLTDIQSGLSLWVTYLYLSQPLPSLPLFFLVIVFFFSPFTPFPDTRSHIMDLLDGPSRNTDGTKLYTPPSLPLLAPLLLLFPFRLLLSCSFSLSYWLFCSLSYVQQISRCWQLIYMYM